MANQENLACIARYGIIPHNILSVSMPNLGKFAREIGNAHELATNLRLSASHDARILTAPIDIPSSVTEHQMDHWVCHFDSREICDQCGSNIFTGTPFMYKKAYNMQFELFFVSLKIGVSDNRNFIKKTVNRALRQIGKHNLTFNLEAVKLAGEIRKMDALSAKWFGADALRELKSPAVQMRLKAPKSRSY